ncbi:MAG: hypothetical protein K2K48_08055 [Anaeroplasmataceae bacterium]|nr:hypothetical protein [Anaeroplasmataceae bacterium]MDE6415357.1 hypothetical protein [Anaeroplasmataceae bacterium]
MKNKILFSILSILGIAACFWLSLIPKEESPLPTTQSISLAAQTITTPTSVVSKENIPIYDWIKTAKMDDSITFNHLTYTHEGARITVTCSNPEEIETLYLYYFLEAKSSAFIPVRHFGLDFTELTNVKKVVIFNNDPFSCFGTELKEIPNSFDLYINGYFESLEEYPNIKELYICEVYDTDKSDIYASSDPHDLAYSHITKVHYADWNKLWTSVNRFSNNEIENADGVSISVDFLDEQAIGFSKELFAPHEDYIFQKEYLGVVAYPIYKGTATKVLPSDLEYIIDSIPNKIKTFILPSDINVTNYGLFYPDTLVIDNVDFNFTSLMNANINTLVFRTHTDDFSFTHMSYVKNIWFAPTETPPAIKHLGVNKERNAQIEHIYIPSVYKEEYHMLEGDFFESRVTYYNMSDLEDYHYSFQSKNNNVYFVEDATLSIDTLESYITEMTEGNFDFTTTEALDTQYQAYLETKPEVPTPTPSDNEDFVDESEFIKGYQALGSIYYTSSKSLDDILKIASNYMLQKDGVRSDEEKEVSFHVDEDTLSVIIKVDGKIVASTVSKLHKLDTKDYGEFIYLGNVATFNGVLLFDTTSTTTKTPAQIYDYLLNELTNAKTVPTPDFKDFSLTTPSAVDISSSLIHTNGNKYKVEMECLSFDLSQAKDLSNPDISHKQEDTPNTPDNKDKDTNSSTDKDKDKEEDKNQSDVKDEGTNNIFNDFKDNFENNKTFKTMSIILGTILGLVLIYVGYRIIKKIHKWLKK